MNDNAVHPLRSPICDCGEDKGDPIDFMKVRYGSMPHQYYKVAMYTFRCNKCYKNRRPHGEGQWRKK